MFSEFVNFLGEYNGIISDRHENKTHITINRDYPLTVIDWLLLPSPVLRCSFAG